MQGSVRADDRPFHAWSRISEVVFVESTELQMRRPDSV